MAQAGRGGASGGHRSPGRLGRCAAPARVPARRLADARHRRRGAPRPRVRPAVARRRCAGRPRAARCAPRHPRVLAGLRRGRVRDVHRPTTGDRHRPGQSHHLGRAARRLLRRAGQGDEETPATRGYHATFGRIDAGRAVVDIRSGRRHDPRRRGRAPRAPEPEPAGRGSPGVGTLIAWTPTRALGRTDEFPRDGPSPMDLQRDEIAADPLIAAIERDLALGTMAVGRTARATRGSTAAASRASSRSSGRCTSWSRSPAVCSGLRSHRPFPRRPTGQRRG